MDAEPVIYREEALGIIGAFADIVVTLYEIRDILRGDDDELEEENDQG